MAGANGSDVWEVFRASAERAPWGWGLFISFIATVLAAWPKLKRIDNERSKQDGELEGARWERLMTLNATLTSRVSALEAALADVVKQAAHDLSEERKRCDAEMAELRKESATSEAELRRDHASEVAEMRKELAGIYRMIGSSNTAAARLFEPRGDLPQEMKDKLRSLEQDGKRRLDRSEE